MSRVIYDVIIYDVLQDSWYDTRLAQAALTDYDYIMIIICIIHPNLQQKKKMKEMKMSGSIKHIFVLRLQYSVLQEL